MEKNPKYWVKKLDPTSDLRLYSMVGDAVADCRFGECQSAVNVKLPGALGTMVFCLLHNPAIPCLRGAVQRTIQEQMDEYKKLQENK